ncbi:hypothetical protein SELMODRAFT_432358 [Selaginella moellendorffii]|uniref:Uncharacterized protein n=1 Tax=Selaginella moellendorffii TaxID=88036 RepID=D8TFR9_SELML|nr:hypothetical protein SELMODRAFT_432358 [Selaginella moellendorffii]
MDLLREAGWCQRPVQEAQASNHNHGREIDTKNIALDTSSLVSTNFGKLATLRGGSSLLGLGLGWYSLKSQPSSPAFSMGSWLADGKRSHSPGPGAQNVKRRPDCPAYPISPRFRDAGKDWSPGPGQHNLPGTFGGPAYIMAWRERGVRKKGLWQSRQERFQLQEKIQFISKAAVESSTIRSNSGTRKIPRRRVSNKRSLKNYQVEDSITSKGELSRTRSLQRCVEAELATPLSRRTKQKIQGQERGKVTSPRQSDVPGPGTYSLRLPRGQTMQSRQSSPRTPNSPGPGSYSPQCRSSSPSFSMREKLPKLSGRDSPSYTSRSSMDGPSFSMHGRLSSPASSTSRSSSPGPGAYTISSRPTSPWFTLYGPGKKNN